MRFIKYLFLELFILVSTTLVGCTLLSHSGNTITLYTLLKKHNLWLQLTRYAVITSILICWPQFVRLVGRRRSWDTEFINALIHKRIWILLFFAVMEILFFYSFK